MRQQKKRIKKAIEALREAGVELTPEQKQKALAGEPVIDNEDIDKFRMRCKEAFNTTEAFVVNFNGHNDHPIFHSYSDYRRLRRHVVTIRALRGKKSVRKIKFIIRKHADAK